MFPLLWRVVYLDASTLTEGEIDDESNGFLKIKVVEIEKFAISDESLKIEFNRVGDFYINDNLLTESPYDRTQPIDEIIQFKQGAVDYTTEGKRSYIGCQVIGYRKGGKMARLFLFPDRRWIYTDESQVLKGEG